MGNHTSNQLGEIAKKYCDIIIQTENLTTREALLVGTLIQQTFSEFAIIKDIERISDKKRAIEELEKV